MFDSPYRTKFGEVNTFKNLIDQVDYLTNNEGGGQKCIDNMSKSINNFEVLNNILQARTNPDSKY